MKLYTNNARVVLKSKLLNFQVEWEICNHTGNVSVR